MTTEQKEILSLLHQNGGTLTKKQVVDSLDGYFCNGAHHIGERLSRMVSAGFLIRVKPGVFQINEAQDENQTTLF